MIKYFHFLYKKMKQYDKKYSKNPFCDENRKNILLNTTYVWIEKPKKVL